MYICPNILYALAAARIVFHGAAAVLMTLVHIIGHFTGVIVRPHLGGAPLADIAVRLAHCSAKQTYIIFEKKVFGLKRLDKK